MLVTRQTVTFSSVVLLMRSTLVSGIVCVVGEKVSSPLWASVPLCHTGGMGRLFLHQCAVKSKGSNRHFWASQAYSTHNKDSPDMVLAFGGSQSVRETQILACQ